MRIYTFFITSMYVLYIYIYIFVGARNAFKRDSAGERGDERSAGGSGVGRCHGQGDRRYFAQVVGVC